MTATDSPNGGAPLSRVSRRRDEARTQQFGQLAEIALPTGSAAPGAARMVVAHCLTGLVSERILLDAQLLVSEVVTNSLRHGEVSDGDIVLVRVYLAADTVRLEIVNRGYRRGCDRKRAGSPVPRWRLRPRHPRPPRPPAGV